MAGIGIDRAQQLTHLFRIEDRRMMRDLRHDQRATKQSRWVGLAAPGGDGIAEYATGEGPAAPRRLILALGLDPLERSQNVDRLEVGDRAGRDWFQLLKQPVGLLRCRL